MFAEYPERFILEARIELIKFNTEDAEALPTILSRKP